MLSGCICVLLAWDEERKNFIEQLRSLGLPLLVFVITDRTTDHADVLQENRPEDVHFLKVGKIQEDLNAL
jgi:hypothetical protein